MISSNYHNISYIVVIVIIIRKEPPSPSPPSPDTCGRYPQLGTGVLESNDPLRCHHVARNHLEHHLGQGKLLDKLVQLTLPNPSNEIPRRFQLLSSPNEWDGITKTITGLTTARTSCLDFSISLKMESVMFM